MTEPQTQTTKSEALTEADRSQTRGSVASVTAGETASKTAPTPQDEAKSTQTTNPKDWPEDLSHENGNYFCKCCNCGSEFIGHKRRVVCKQCANDAYKNFSAEKVENAQ